MPSFVILAALGPLVLTLWLIVAMGVGKWLKASRKRRIAAGAGVEVQEVNRLLTQFEQMQTMMKQFKGGKMARTMASMAAKGAAKGIGGLFKK